MNRAAEHNPSIVSKSILFIIYFLYMFSLQFVFVPGGLGTRAIIGAIGIVYLFVVKFGWIVSVFQTGKLKVRKHQFRVIAALALFWIMACFANLANGTSERSFLFYPVSMILIFSAAFMIADITRRIYRRLTFEIVANYFVAIVLSQMYIALIMFFVPAVKSAVANFLLADDIMLNQLSGESGFRLMGLGVQFFGAGIINSIALMIIATLFRYDCNSLKRAFYLTFAFLSIFGFGMMMARTTLVGGGLAIASFALGMRFRGGGAINLRRTFVSVGIILAFAVCAYGTLSFDKKAMISGVGEYGFEMFVNYFETGTASTESSDQLKEMYNTYPTNFKTWLIGDGYYANPVDPGLYYMSVDVGYLRLIFYCGLIGMLLFYYYQWALIASINRNTNGKYRQFLFFIFIFVLIVHLKGFADMTSLVAPFMFFTPNVSNQNG